MNPADLRAFAERDWVAAERNKRDYWAACYRNEGGGPAWRAAAALLEHARRLGGGPTDVARTEDFAHHLHVCEQLDRVRAFTGR